jgi:hypothetical protein
MVNVFRSQSHKLFAVAGLALSLLLSACQPIQPLAEPAATSPQPIVIELTADGLKVPEEMPSGIVTVTYKNSSDKPALLGLGWMVEGSTLADLEKAMQENDFRTFYKILIPAGEANNLAPGERREVTSYIKAGEIDAAYNPMDGNPIVFKKIKATTASTMAAPTADYKVELADFAFIMPDEIAAGKHLWEVKNTGKQIHTVGILKLNEGVTLEDVIKLMSSQEPPSGPPPFEEIPFDVFIGGGATTWVTSDIPAGEYTVICGLPNTDDEKMAPHAAMGMVRKLVVK